MKVLWLCNIMLPFIAKSLGQKIVVKEGWLSGSIKQLQKDENQQIELAVCFPNTDIMQFARGDDSLFYKGIAEGISYYIFREDTVNPERYDSAIEESLKAVLDDFCPDIVHIFGTEYPHTLAMARVFANPDRLLIGIQGVCTACADVYMADLPGAIQKRKTFRDVLKKDSLQEQQEKFYQRAENEKEALKLAGHVTGRTDFDKEYMRKLAPQAVYHFMNETLREDFYQEKWNIDKIESYSIFVSQGNYPLKGLHFVLDILQEIVEEYEETMVYIAGDVITANQTLKDKIKISNYGKYLLEQIRKKKLEKHVKFTGPLNADKMCARYLKSHVFLCPSVLENSPNSVGEAMLLGVPVVAADVGGIPNMLTDGKDGILYSSFHPKQMKEAILRIFGDDKLAMSFSSSAREHAAKTHDPVQNYKRLMEIYHEIYSSI